MTHAPYAEKLWDLFRGRTDAVGTDEGGCMRIEWHGANHPAVPDHMLFDLTASHLDGLIRAGGPVSVRSTGIGVYPLMDDNTVRWGCVDFDEGDQESWVHAVNLSKALKACDITSWIERSRSKGYHVWVFLTEWCDASLVREALLAACQIVDAPTKEINPKQTDVSSLGAGFGNYVRLPYKDWLVAEEPRPSRQVMVDANGQPIPLDTFLQEASRARVDPSALEPLAALYEPPKKFTPPPADWKIDTDQDAVRRMTGKTFVVWRDGPLEGTGRGHTLYKLACLLREDGRHTFAEAFELVRDADLRWGKFHDRADCEVRLQQTIERAWGGVS